MAPVIRRSGVNAFFRLQILRMLVVTTVLVAVLVSPALVVMAEEDYSANVANGGDADSTAESSVYIGSITTGLNAGHAVEVGDTADGDVTVNVGELGNEADLGVSAGDNTSNIAEASGGDESRLPGRAVGDVDIDVDPNIRTNSNSSAEGGAGGAGGSGTGGAGGAGGTGGAGGGGGAGGDSGN